MNQSKSGFIQKSLVAMGDPQGQQALIAMIGGFAAFIGACVVFYQIVQSTSANPVQVVSNPGRPAETTQAEAPPNSQRKKGGAPWDLEQSSASPSPVSQS